MGAASLVQREDDANLAANKLIGVTAALSKGLNPVDKASLVCLLRELADAVDHQADDSKDHHVDGRVLN